MNIPGQTFNVSTKNVTITRSTLVSNDFAIGSECSGGCEDISLLDSVMSDARGSAIDVLRIKSAAGRGGYIRNILVQNVTALALKNAARPPDGFRCTVSGGTPVTNVSIINVQIGSANGIAGQFIGDRIARWKGLTLRNVSVGSSKHPSWECINVEDAVFDNVTPAVEGSCKLSTDDGAMANTNPWNVALSSSAWNGTCELRDGDCPSLCPDGQGTLSATPTVRISQQCATAGLCRPTLGSFEQAAASADKIIRAQKSNGSDIISFVSLFSYHSLLHLAYLNIV